MYKMTDDEFDKIEEREISLNDERMIVQSNYIIEHKGKLSLPATLLLLSLTAMIQPKDDAFKKYKIDVSDFARYWGYDKKRSYSDIENALRELRQFGLTNYFVNPETKRMVVEESGFISYFRYEYGEGHALVTFDPEIQKYYINVDKEFTAFITQNIRKMYFDGALSSSIRTYEILRQYLTVGERKLSVLEYKEFLGMVKRNKKGIVVSEKYKGSNANLKEKVLEPAKDKINGNTDIVIDYEILGRGSAAEILFTIKNASKITLESKTSETNFQSVKFPEQVLRRMLGLGERDLTTREKKMFTQWYGEWSFSDDIVRLAFEKTVNTISRADLNYINAILRRWQSMGYTTVDEIEEKDSKFIQSNSSFDDELIKVALARGFDGLV